MGQYYQVIKQTTFSLKRKPEDGFYHSLVMKTPVEDVESVLLVVFGLCFRRTDFIFEK